MPKGIDNGVAGQKRRLHNIRCNIPLNKWKIRDLQEEAKSLYQVIEGAKGSFGMNDVIMYDRILGELYRRNCFLIRTISFVEKEEEENDDSSIHQE